MMMKLLRNEDGLTLVELLATFVVSSLILMFIISIHVLIQKQYTSQQQEVSNLTDVKIAMKAITRDIRKADHVEVLGDDTLKIVFENTDAVVYHLDPEKTLLKNGSSYILNVTYFKVELEENKISLEIASEDEKAKTEIVLRE